MAVMLKRGSKGDQVRQLQHRLSQLGFSLSADGDFGPDTEKAVRELQTLFGYTVDGIVGEGTDKLIDQQLGYGWNVGLPDAKERAQRAQGEA